MRTQGARGRASSPPHGRFALWLQCDERTGWQAWAAYNAGPYSLNPYVWAICAYVT